MAQSNFINHEFHMKTPSIKPGPVVSVINLGTLYDECTQIRFKSKQKLIS
jgi:hypothetical protein